MNFILFQLKFLKFKSKIKFIKFELHNYAFRGLSVCLPACLSRSCIVLKRQNISTDFFCMRQLHVSPRSR